MEAKVILFLRSSPSQKRCFRLSSYHNHGVLTDFMMLGITLSFYSPASTVQNVRLCHLEEAVLHQFFLHNVLNILDIDKCLPSSNRTAGNLIRHPDCRFWIEPKRKECFANSHPNFGRIPRHNCPLLRIKRICELSTGLSDKTINPSIIGARKDANF